MMTDPIDRIFNYCHQRQPHEWEVKLISTLPIINNIFFQIKSEQFAKNAPLSNVDRKTLQDFGWVFKCGLCAQIMICGKPLAMILERLTFTDRVRLLVNTTLYVILSHEHIKALTPD